MNLSDVRNSYSGADVVEGDGQACNEGFRIITAGPGEEEPSKSRDVHYNSVHMHAHRIIVGDCIIGNVEGAINYSNYQKFWRL